MIYTILRYLTPFIASVNNTIYGVLLYLQCKDIYEASPSIYKTFDILSGSSILFISYLISASRHMCKYYKTSCWLLMIMHIMSIIYLYTPITVIEYIYALTVLSMISTVASTAAILGHKTYKTIHQACTREQTE